VPGRKARLFWHHHVDPLVIRASASPSTIEDAEAFDLLAEPLAATILRGGSACEEVILHGSGGSVRLSLTEGTLLAGPVRLTYDVAGRTLLHRHLFALNRLAALMHARRIPNALRLPAPWHSQWSLLIRAIDAMAYDPRPRPVAMALFGETEVDAQWTPQSDRLRMQVRRLIARAHRLLRGGYLDILR
jgi:hypothetical protein